MRDTTNVRFAPQGHGSRTVLIAPDSFKGSVDAAAAARAIALGWASVRPQDELRIRPMADGGEGTLDAFEAATRGATRVPVEVAGPDGRRVPASWLRLPPSADAPDGIGVVELATTSGIRMMETLRPRDAHTIGLGEAIGAALDAGVSQVLVGLGSSASTDGGAGVLTALGARLLDRAGHPIVPGSRGLDSLASVDLAALRAMPPGGVVLLTDVTNPLLGPDGAAAIYGPQKGATLADTIAMDAALERWSGMLDVDARAPGTGAAGGTAFGLMAWGAEIRSGAAEIGALLRLPEAASGADIVVTGEGRYDRQSANGKVPAYIADLAASSGIRALLIAGSIGIPPTEFSDSVSLAELAGSVDASMGAAEQHLRSAAALLASNLRGTARAGRLRAG